MGYGKDKEEQQEGGNGRRNGSTGREGSTGRGITKGKEKNEGKTGSRNNSTGRESAGANASTHSTVTATKVSKSKSKSKVAIEYEDEPEDCVLCKHTFYDGNDKLLQCERCNSWTCAACANVSDAEYEVMSRPDCHWYCEGYCNQRATRAVLDEKSVEDRCKEFLQNFEMRLEKLETEIAHKAPKEDLTKMETHIRTIETKIDKLMTKEEIIVQATTEAAESGLKEMENRELRKTNLVVFGVKESESPTTSIRKKEDTEKLEELLSKGLEIDIQVKSVKRLGKFEKDDGLSTEERKPRPILAVLGSQQERDNVLDSFREMKKRNDGKKLDKDIGMKRDMTPTERSEETKLYQQLKAKREEATASGDDNAFWVRRGNRIINIGKYPAKGVDNKEKQ